MDERTNALPVGTEIEGYRIVALLGAGGFGITYKALDLLLDRAVAVKEYLPSALATRIPGCKTVRPFGRQETEQFSWGLERFRTEARTLVAFQHPNIVPVHRYFEAGGTGYLVMAFQDGKSLADVIDAVGALSEDELLTILRPLAAGLSEVHAKGFLHRDIKPANIIIRRDGAPILIDFGAARQAVTRESRGLTAIVTEGYAPYEQYVTDSHQGPWTDLYALGAVLYHCVTGQRPPEAPKRIAAKLRHQPDPMAPAAEAAIGYSDSLLAAIDAALSVEEENRPQDVAAFMAMVQNRPRPASDSPAAVPAGESYMVEGPSMPAERARRRAAIRRTGPPSAETAGNFMVDAPSVPLRHGEARSDAAGPGAAGPGAAGSQSRQPRPPPSRAPLSGAPPSGGAQRGDTLMAGSATLLVGETGGRTAAHAATPGGQDAPPPGEPAPGEPAPGEPASGDPASPGAGGALRRRSSGLRAAPDDRPLPATLRRRRTVAKVAAGLALFVLVGVGIGYLAQREEPPKLQATPAAPEHEATKSTVAQASPKITAEGLARSKAAAPEKTWERLEVRNGQDVVRRIFALGDGKLLVAGGRIDGEGNNSDAWLWQLDAKTGEPMTARVSIPSTRLDTGNQVILLADGALAIAGMRRNPANNDLVAWVARIGQDGTTQWEQTFLDRPLTVPYAVTAMPNGDIVVAGTATQDEKTGPQGWAARISADGKTVLWNKVFGKGGDDSLQAVKPLADGGVIAVGWTSVERPAGEDRNLWVVNLDGDGKMRWEKKDLGDEADEKGKAVRVTPEGDLVVLAEASRVPAESAAPTDSPDGSTAVNKPWLLRLTADGAVRWQKRDFGGKPDESDTFEAFAPAGDGGFFIVGATESKGAGRKDAWLVRVDADGKMLWDTIFGEQFDDEFTALAAMADGGVVVGGGTAKLIESTAPKQNPQAEAKLWLMRLGYQ